MVHIIGGFYEELCLYPQWHQNYGSGGKAVASLSKFGADIHFHTYIHNNKLLSLEYFSKLFKVEIHPYKSTENIRFEYYHALSKPNIYTVFNPIEQQNQIEITEDIVICYGMLEAPNPIINADYLVFDPQSENNPSMILGGESRINHLVLIMNLEEGKKYTNVKSIDEIAEVLFAKSDKLEVLILKDGPFGAHLFFDKSHHHIDSYMTDKIFKIGSGDVFVGIFGYLWAKDKLSPLEAAHKASLATAFYCNNTVLPIDKNLLNNPSPFNMIKVEKEIFKKKIYLAGPFFTMSERWLIEEAKYQLEKFGASVFSPLHDVGFGEANVVVKEDLSGIGNADILYAVLNEYDPGTIFEIGYAISKNIPVIIFIENMTPINMTMFEGSGCIIENDFSTSIYKVIWEASKTL